MNREKSIKPEALKFLLRKPWDKFTMSLKCQPHLSHIFSRLQPCRILSHVRFYLYDMSFIFFISTVIPSLLRLPNSYLFRSQPRGYFMYHVYRSWFKCFQIL